MEARVYRFLDTDPVSFPHQLPQRIMTGVHTLNKCTLGPNYSSAIIESSSRITLKTSAPYDQFFPPPSSKASPPQLASQRFTLKTSAP